MKMYALKTVYNYQKIQEKNRAFTLAETLITLVIIGVVAAVTVPALRHAHHNKETVARLKHAYSVIAQVMYKNRYEDILDNYGGCTSFTELRQSWFDVYMKPNLHIMRNCMQGESGNYGKCWHKDNVIKYLNGQTCTEHIYGCVTIHNNSSFILTDGTLIYTDYFALSSLTGTYAISTADNYSHSIVFMVDVNGFKGPNQMGRDIFYMVYTKKGLLVAGSAATSSVLNANCSKNGKGNLCMGKLLKDNWEINY